MSTPSAVQAVIRALLAASEDARVVALDAVGDAVGTQAFTQADIESVIHALESAGRTITSPPPGTLTEGLRTVLPAARAFAANHGRNATVQELAVVTGLSTDAVRAALGLARVLGR